MAPSSTLKIRIPHTRRGAPTVPVAALAASTNPDNNNNHKSELQLRVHEIVSRLTVPAARDSSEFDEDDCCSDYGDEGDDAHQRDEDDWMAIPAATAAEGYAEFAGQNPYRNAPLSVIVEDVAYEDQSESGPKPKSVVLPSSLPNSRSRYRYRPERDSSTTTTTETHGEEQLDDEGIIVCQTITVPTLRTETHEETLARLSSQFEAMYDVVRAREKAELEHVRSSCLLDDLPGQATR